MTRLCGTSGMIPQKSVSGRLSYNMAGASAVTLDHEMPSLIECSMVEQTEKKPGSLVTAVTAVEA